MPTKRRKTQFAVLGLGRFGLSVVQSLSEYNVSILAVDKDPARLQAAAPYATHVVQADMADELAMSSLGLGNFDVVVIAAGEIFEASLIITMLAKEQGAGEIIVKARGQRQKKILLSVGADEVILPEYEMGIKVARNLVGPNIMDILDASGQYVIAEMKPMEEWVGKTVGESDIRREHRLSILAIRRQNRMIIPVLPTEVVEAEDVLITLSETPDAG